MVTCKTACARIGCVFPDVKLITYSAKQSIAAFAAIILISFSICGQSPRTSTDNTAERQLNLLVLGDSILWGQGLKEEHKAWYQVKNWMQKTSGRMVREKIEAHSGALVGSAGDSPWNTATRVDGEVNRPAPTVNDQIDDALKSYADPSQVDLVLVDGCINDIDARRFLNAANTPDGIRNLTHEKCGSLVEAALGRITSSFPKAHVIVTGYFPVISDQTENDLFMRVLAKRFYTPAAGAPKISDKQLRARLIEISKEWYQASNQSLTEAARKVDGQLAAKGSRQRVLFAEITFLPKHSFGTSESRLWGFDASALRKLLVVLTFGKVTIRANDERRSQRAASCKEVFKRSSGETDDQKRTREGNLMLCRLAAVGHPNRKGAVMYAEAISKQLKLLVDEAGWFRDGRSVTTPGNPIH